MADEITLYTTHCPKCKVLEAKLKQKGVEFAICDSIEEMTTMGIVSVPMLKINNALVDFAEAVALVNKMEVKAR